MRKLLPVFIALSLSFLTIPSCTSIPPRPYPHYKGVDPAFNSIVDTYMALSADNDIHFKHKVSIGFAHINKAEIVGICYYGAYFREIEIDIDYWKRASNDKKVSLLFHELGHCYCNRDHDYGENKAYPEESDARILLAMKWQVSGGERPGYWEDGCPVSLMYPVVIDDDCLQNHYSSYIKEMFNRCNPF